MKIWRALVLLFSLTSFAQSRPATSGDERQQLLQALADAAGPSGFEEPVRKIMVERMKPLAEKLSYDGLGSVIAVQGSHNGIMNRGDFDKMVELLVAVLQKLDAKTVANVRTLRRSGSFTSRAERGNPTGIEDRVLLSWTKLVGRARTCHPSYAFQSDRVLSLCSGLKTKNLIRNLYHFHRRFHVMHAHHMCSLEHGSRGGGERAI
jgi:hypothetical protein